MRYNLEEREGLITLRAKGYSFDRIAKKLGRAKQTLLDWSKDLQEEIANRKAMEMEALYEEYFLLKEARLKNFANLLSKVREEIATRDLSDVPTEKLLDLFLKFNTQIKEELVEISFKSSEEVAEEKADRVILDRLTGLNEPSERRLKLG